jgi:hypothetical protein
MGECDSFLCLRWREYYDVPALRQEGRLGMFSDYLTTKAGILTNMMTLFPSVSESVSFRGLGKLNQDEVHSILRINCSLCEHPACCTQFQPHDFLWLTVQLDLTILLWVVWCTTGTCQYLFLLRTWRSNAISSVAFLTLWCLHDYFKNFSDEFQTLAEIH